ncbi:MAG: type II toxin-antitoxin system RelE/ParE family toxin [Nitrospiraceae bacterium]|nr:MAG: type II toxin-antitoxin system RelE/ParE family toxin [Nitrospiraceae bacterium]
MTEDALAAFREWLVSLRDIKTRAKTRMRLDRVSLGHLGYCHGMSDGTRVLRIEYGPHERVYCDQVSSTIVLLLSGGDKNTQANDIEQAKYTWNECRRR